MVWARHLLQPAALREAGRAVLDHHQVEGRVRVAHGRVTRGHDDHVGVGAVRDEGLGAVQDQVVALLDDGGADGGQVAAGVGLGHGHRGDALAAHAAGKQAVLHLVARERGEVGHHDVAVEGRGQPREHDACQLFGHDHGVQEVAARAAVRLGHVGAQEALLSHATPGRARHEALVLPAGDVRDDLAIEEPPDRRAEDAMLVVVGERAYGGLFHGQESVLVQQVES
jgi:hypothetical protein